MFAGGGDPPEAGPYPRTPMYACVDTVRHWRRNSCSARPPSVSKGRAPYANIRSSCAPAIPNQNHPFTPGYFPCARPGGQRPSVCEIARKGAIREPEGPIVKVTVGRGPAKARRCDAVACRTTVISPCMGAAFAAFFCLPPRRIRCVAPEQPATLDGHRSGGWAPPVQSVLSPLAPLPAVLT